MPSTRPAPTGSSRPGKTAGTVNATGAAFDVDELHLLTVRDGKVVRFEAYIDTPAMLAALGEEA